jgi:hypothetical protein
VSEEEQRMAIVNDTAKFVALAENHCTFVEDYNILGTALLDHAIRLLTKSAGLHGAKYQLERKLTEMVK